MNRTCNVCGKEITEIDLPKWRYRCKSCDAEKSKRYYQKNREKVLQRTRKYPKRDPHFWRQYWREYHLKHAEARKERYRKYRLQHHDRLLRKEQERRNENKDRIHAQNLANRNIPLGSHCELCGTTERLERHHPDYNKPLEIITVCHRCHLRIHRSNQPLGSEAGFHNDSIFSKRVSHKIGGKLELAPWAPPAPASLY